MILAPSQIVWENWIDENSKEFKLKENTPSWIKEAVELFRKKKYKEYFDLLKEHNI